MAKKKKEPRYIDANLVKEALMGWDTDPTDEEIEYTIDKIPTADVAPRAEVAREIFKEIAVALASHYCSCLPRGATEHYEYYEGDLADAIAELKKKYTEKR